MVDRAPLLTPKPQNPTNLKSRWMGYHPLGKLNYYYHDSSMFWQYLILLKLN